jgi:hypothetical protein
LTSIVCWRARNELTYPVSIGASFGTAGGKRAIDQLSFTEPRQVSATPPAAQMRLKLDPSPKANCFSRYRFQSSARKRKG